MSAASEKLKQAAGIEIGKGFDYLLSKACELLVNPIIMYDTNYNLIANTQGVSTDDSFWNELVTTGVFGEESQEFFREEGFIDAVANAKTITYLLSDKLKYERITGKLFNQNHTHVANLTLIACVRPFKDGEDEIFGDICQVFSDEICTNEFYRDYENAYQETLIKKLINGDFIHKELYAAHIAILYGALKANLYVAVADISPKNLPAQDASTICDLARKKAPPFIYAIYGEHLVILISTDNQILDTKKDLGQLAAFLKQISLHAGLSTAFENIYELSKYYNEAVEALKAGTAARSPHRFHKLDVKNWRDSAQD